MPQSEVKKHDRDQWVRERNAKREARAQRKASEEQVQQWTWDDYQEEDDYGRDL